MALAPAVEYSQSHLYRPREPKVRDICKIAGVVWPEPSRPVREEHPDSSWEEEESEEEEEVTDDETVPILEGASNLFISLAII